jgi:hypothetical protein
MESPSIVLSKVGHLRILDQGNTDPVVQNSKHLVEVDWLTTPILAPFYRLRSSAFSTNSSAVQIDQNGLMILHDPALEADQFEATVKMANSSQVVEFVVKHNNIVRVGLKVALIHKKIVLGLLSCQSSKVNLGKTIASRRFDLKFEFTQ